MDGGGSQQPSIVRVLSGALRRSSVGKELTGVLCLRLILWKIPGVFLAANGAVENNCPTGCTECLDAGSLDFSAVVGALNMSCGIFRHM
jgi:hypothetical protein